MADPVQVEFYDNFVDHFSAQQDNGRNRGFRAWIQKWIHQPKKVLDFGCALGYSSQFLYRTVGCEVHGIDISPRCIALAQEKYPECSWYCGDVTDGFDPGVRGFDFILLSDVIEHVPEERHERLFRLFGEWSSPGAVILASVPNEEYYEQAKVATYQPVEEKMEIPRLLNAMRVGGFSRVVSLFLEQRLYYRMVVQRVSP